MAFCFSLFARKLQSPDRYLRKMKARGSKLFSGEKELLCETDISEKPLPSAPHLSPTSPLRSHTRRMLWVERCCTTHRCRPGKAISTLDGFQRNTFCLRLIQESVLAQRGPLWSWKPGDPTSNSDRGFGFTLGQTQEPGLAQETGATLTPFQVKVKLIWFLRSLYKNSCQYFSCPEARNKVVLSAGPWGN